MTLDEIKELYADMKDPGELSVGYVRSYDKIYEWLTNPPDKKGLGADAVFATKLLASVANKIKQGHLEFDKPHKLDVYLKQRVLKYQERATSQGELILQHAAADEIAEILYGVGFEKAQKSYIKAKKKEEKAEKKRIKKEKKAQEKRLKKEEKQRKKKIKLAKKKIKKATK